MKNVIYLIGILVVTCLFSCSSGNSDKALCCTSVETTLVSLNTIPSEQYKQTATRAGEVDKENAGKPFSNPMLVFGSDMGMVLKNYYRSIQFDEMMLFTSSESIKKFGYDKILNYYKNDADFSYRMSIKSFKKEGDLYTLSYQAVIKQTERQANLNFKVENDTAKIVLDNLVFVLGFNFPSNK